MRNDLVLLVETQEFHVHRDVLCAYSPVFKAMLESDFREKRMEKIPLPGKSVQQILEMLNFIYPFGHEINGRFFTWNSKVESNTSLYKLANIRMHFNCSCYFICTLLIF